MCHSLEYAHLEQSADIAERSLAYREAQMALMIRTNHKGSYTVLDRCLWHGHENNDGHECPPVDIIACRFHGIGEVGQFNSCYWCEVSYFEGPQYEADLQPDF